MKRDSSPWLNLLKHHGNRLELSLQIGCIAITAVCHRHRLLLLRCVGKPHRIHRPQSRDDHAKFPHFFPLQVAGFCLSAAYSALMLKRYLKLDAKDRVWRHYGTFAALMCCGSIVGAISWIARMQELLLLYVSEDSLRAGNYAGFLSGKSHVPSPHDVLRWNRSCCGLCGCSLRSRLMSFSGESRKYYWKAVFSVFYPLEFAFLSIAKLTVLDRLVSFAVPSSSTELELVSLRRKLYFVFRATIFTAISGSVVGLCGNIASVVYCVQIGSKTSELLAVFAANTTAPQPNFENSQLYRDIVETLKDNDRVLSIQLFCELIVLVVIVAVVAVVGAICLRRMHSVHSQMLLLNQSMLERLQKSARTLKLRLVTTVSVIFFAFTLRSVFAIMCVRAPAPRMSACTHVPLSVMLPMPLKAFAAQINAREGLPFPTVSPT